MAGALDRGKLAGLTDCENLEQLDYLSLQSSIRSDPKIGSNLPKGYFRQDPRSKERILYSQARARRPVTREGEALTLPPEEGVENCPLCQGETTSFIDVAPLSSGHTLINKNLYPVLYPGGEGAPSFEQFSDLSSGRAKGLHFLQWVSTEHDKELHKIPLSDALMVLDRLSCLERFLLHESGDSMPSTIEFEEEEHFGYSTIIKNYGFGAGGSLSHPHQQIVHANVMPLSIAWDLQFKRDRGLSFARFLQENNDSKLDVFEIGPAKVVVPYFMHRPLHSIILIGYKDRQGDLSYLHHLDSEEAEALVISIRKVMTVLIDLMPRMGRLPCFNVLFHCGPIGRMYVEICAHTQERAGLEHMGLSVCQGLAEDSARFLREAML